MATLGLSLWLPARSARALLCGARTPAAHHHLFMFLRLLLPRPAWNGDGDGAQRKRRSREARPLRIFVLPTRTAQAPTCRWYSQLLGSAGNGMGGATQGELPHQRLTAHGAAQVTTIQRKEHACRERSARDAGGLPQPWPFRRLRS